MGFTTNPALTIAGRKSWRLDGPLTYRTSLRYRSSDPETFTVPEGFKTDLASIPRFALWLIPVNGRHRKAAILHDYLYRIGFKGYKADAIFREAALSDNVPRWQVFVMYKALRIAAGFRRVWP